MSSSNVKHEFKKCRFCSAKFKQLYHLKYHINYSHNKKTYECDFCETLFTDPSNRCRHVRNFHRKTYASKNSIPSSQVLKNNDENDGIGLQKMTTRSQNKKSIDERHSTSPQLIPDKAKLLETAFKSRIATYRMENKNEIHDPLQYLEVNKKNIITLIEKHIRYNPCLKVNFMFSCTHTNIVGENQERSFKTRNVALYPQSDIESYVVRSFSILNREMTELASKKSGWSIHSVNHLEIRINKYTPLVGHRFIPLPKETAAKGAVINVQNNDSKCFKYAVLSKFLDQKNHSERCYQYDSLKHPYDFSSTNFPTALHDIPRFEKENNISINIFGLDKSNKVYPIKVVENELQDHRDLLFLDDKCGNSHYCYIKNFEKLVASQLTSDGHKLLICKKCFQHYYSNNNGKRKMRNHKRLCMQHKTTRIEMPNDSNNKLLFKNSEYETELPITICADFESVIMPASGCDNNPAISSSQVTQTHKLMSYCYFVKHNLPLKVVKGLPAHPVLYRAKSETDDVGKHFMQEISLLARKVSDIYKLNEPMMALTVNEKLLHDKAVSCFFCKNKFTKENHKTRDHDHITGKYRQPLCNKCNLKNRKKMVLPIVFHNLSNYDAHHLVRKLDSVKGDINVIPSTEEKYISFTKKIYNIHCRFLDSYRFMSDNLSKLAEYLPQNKFIETKNYFNNVNIEILTNKCTFPYEYIDSLEKLKITKLPPIEKFYSSLTESTISEKEYVRCQNLWKTFDIKNLGDFSDLYLIIDCLLLTDIFYNFRKVCMKYYKLDPAHYFTTPGLSWDAMLRMTGVEFELISDYDIFMTVESGIRGGLTQCSTRHAVANNPYLSNYNPEEETSYIMFKDANNLYAAAMCEPLPYGGFEINEENISVGDIEALDDEGPYGYMFVVDIKYPTYLHNIHSCLPFLPESVKPPGSQNKKLLATLDDKKFYILHYRALKQAMQHGLVVEKIHSVIKFKQSRWMKQYIEFNTYLRQNADNEFDVAFFKYMNNAVYGKCIEQLRNRMNIKLISCDKKMNLYLKKATFIDRTIYEENLAAVHLARECVLMNRPIFVGQAVLDLSKVIMYNFYYNVMKKRYGESLTLLYTDTDSFIMKIICRDFYSDMKRMSKYFDTSNYPSDHPCFSTKNKKVLAKFKDELAGIVISEFCGLRAKVYAFKFLQCVIKRLKGIKKYALRSKIHFEDYIKCLTDTKLVLHTSYYSILSKKHCLTTNKCTKVALSAYDDKRYIRKCGIRTLPWGHYRIPRLEEKRISSISEPPST
jgi:hypothetical protein